MFQDAWRPRRSIRAAVEVPIRLRADGRSLKAVGTELNEHGLFIRTEIRCAFAPLWVEIGAPDGPLRFVAQPRFIGETSRGSGVGVEIAAIDEADRRRWLAFVRGLLTPQSQPTPRAVSIE
jgi:hypothetical protein